MNDSGHKASYSDIPQEKVSGVFLRKTVVRLLITYLTPFILLTVYFILQSNKILNESRGSHLRSIAENQANTLDLFLRERIVNLSNLIDDPKLEVPPSSVTMQMYLFDLKRRSDTFIDIGFFDSSGVQVAYAGPFPSLEYRNYSSEQWYVNLRDKADNFIITDIYLGFREQPHFTIGVSRIINGHYVVLRATLEPEKIYEYVTSLEGAEEVYSSILNMDGYYQVVTPHVGSPLEESSVIPPLIPRLGIERVRIDRVKHSYGYSWLRTADWALIVQFAGKTRTTLFPGVDLNIFLVSLAIMTVILVVIIFRAKKLVQLQRESQQTKVQLEHASKLASVGELAAGIAHEINNPLAIISEEAGLMKDLMRPEFGAKITPEDFNERLDEIHNAVFRCRDITRKLLGFVRQTDIHISPHQINNIISDVLDGFLTREMEASNIEIVRELEPDLPLIISDRNQLEQVFLNIINNSIDAIGEGPGRITISTSLNEDDVYISISDTGKGMIREVLNRIFLPFYTTKDVGKGTGLGLSVSYGIVKSHGGKILVESEPGKGSTFTIVLPTK